MLTTCRAIPKITQVQSPSERLQMRKKTTHRVILPFTFSMSSGLAHSMLARALEDVEVVKYGG